MPVDIQLSGMEVSLVNVMSREPILRQYPDIQLKTPSSYRDVPIPDYVFEAILEQRKIYERNRSRRKSKFQDDDYICCSSYGRPRSKYFHFKYYKQLLKENDLPDIRWHDLDVYKRQFLTCAAIRAAIFPRSAKSQDRFSPRD